MASRETVSWTPVRSVSEVKGLDSQQVLAGYRAGMVGLPCPPEAPRAWWHGWRNGCVDAGLAEPALDQRYLAQRMQLAWLLAVWVDQQKEIPAFLSRH
jgi:hypothetical protein